MRFGTTIGAVLLAGVALLALSAPASPVAPAQPGEPLSLAAGAAPTVAPSPTVSASLTPPPDSRIGGSDPTAGPRKPGWVWWVAAAFLVILGAGGFRLWRAARD